MMYDDKYWRIFELMQPIKSNYLQQKKRNPKLKEKEYGKDGCKFIADAIATFGGYIDADDPQLV